jgi:hypothetical protein
LFPQNNKKMVSTRRGARTSPPQAAAAATTTKATGGALTSPSSTSGTRAPSPKAINKEICQIMRQLKETLQYQMNQHGEVFEFYAAAISRLYCRLRELYDEVLFNQGGHVDTPRPNVHQPRSLANLDTEIINLYNVLESHKPTKKKTHDAGKKILGDETLSAQHRLRYLIMERIRLGQQEEDRRALSMSQGLFGDYHHGGASGTKKNGGNGLFGSSAPTFVDPSNTASVFTFSEPPPAGAFSQGIMAPPTAHVPQKMQQPSLCRPTQGATTSSSTKVTFEELAMRGKRASHGVKATAGSSVPRGLFSSGSMASAATQTTAEPSFTFRERATPTPSSFSFGKATPGSESNHSTSSNFIFRAAGSTATGISPTISIQPSARKSFETAFLSSTPLGVATSHLPSHLRFGSVTSTSGMSTPGDLLNSTTKTSRSDQAVGSAASSFSQFSLSSPAPRRESFSFGVPTPKSSNTRSTKRNRKFAD